MNRSWTLLALVLLGLLAAAVAPPGCSKPPPPATGLRLSVIRNQDVPDTLRVGGRVTFDDFRISHVFSPVTGRVVKLLAGPGDRLKKGAPLALISSPDVGSAWSDVVKARADLDASQREY